MCSHFIKWKLCPICLWKKKKSIFILQILCVCSIQNVIMLWFIRIQTKWEKKAKITKLHAFQNQTIFNYGTFTIIMKTKWKKQKKKSYLIQSDKMWVCVNCVCSIFKEKYLHNMICDRLNWIFFFMRFVLNIILCFAVKVQTMNLFVVKYIWKFNPKEYRNRIIAF